MVRRNQPGCGSCRDRICGHRNAEAALMMWAMKVRQDGEWDRKSKIAARFLSPSNHSHYWYTYDQVKY